MRRFTLFIVALILWLLLTTPFDWQHLCAGVLVSFLVAIIFGNSFAQEPGKWFQVGTGFLIWALVGWALRPLPLPVWARVILGLAVSLVYGAFCRRYLWLLVYIPLFLWECFKANLDVAYRVLHPAMPISPGIVKVRTNLKTDIARTCLANSITMTPGTLTVDIKDEYLYIHWIYVRSKEMARATKIIVARFEKILKRIFE